MSWVTVIGPTVTSACLTLAAMHGLVWFRSRSRRAHLLFALTAMGTAGMAMIELAMMRAATPDRFAALLRWYHVPTWVVVLSLVGFVRSYLRAGRAWLAWSVCGLRTLSLLFDFTTGSNLDFREVAGLRHLPFLGGSVALGMGVVNPWVLTGQLSLLLLAVFAADAALVSWRRGERQLALTVGGSIVFFTLFGTAMAVCVSWGLAPVPIIMSLAFLGVVAAMAWELSREEICAVRLDRNLCESEARYRGIFEGAIEGLFRTSPEGNLLVANPALARILGYDSPEDVVRSVEHAAYQVWADPEERDRCVRRLEAEGSVRGYECRFTRKEGAQIWVSLSARAVRGPDGRTAYFDGFVEDITGRRESEAALRASQLRLASGAELAGLGFHEFIGRETVVHVDDRTRAICGIPRDVSDGAVRKFWLEHIHPDDVARIVDMHQRMSAGRLEHISAEYRYLHPDGRELWIHHLSTVTRRDDAGRSLQWIGVMRDITEQKRIARELAEQRLHLAHVARVATVGQLASSLAHELNQPLGAILRNAEAAELILQDPSPDLDEVRAILDDIRADDQRAGAVIDRMRDLLKRRPIERAPLDLGVVAEEVIALVRSDAEAHRVRVTLESTPGLPPVLADRVQMQQVLLNLLLNAMDAMHDNPPGRRHVAVRAQSGGGSVGISVIDNGRGIPVEKFSRIFEPFFTTKANGLGMGLAISRSIVEAHGGQLRPQNNPEGGATFTFSLPVVKGGGRGSVVRGQ